MPESKDDILDNVFKGLQPEPEGKPAAKKGKDAPSVHTKHHFEDDLRMVGSLGVKGFPNLFGQKLDDKSDKSALPINLGSKAEAGALPKESRLRVLDLKKTLHNVQLQSEVMFKGQHITPAMMMETDAYKYHFAPKQKDFNITDFSNWIQTVNARFYFEEYEIPFLLADQFDQLPMDAPTVEVPGDIGHLEGVEETDIATFTNQSNTQDQYTVVSRNNVVHTQITQDFLSDSFPSYMEKLRRDVLLGNARAYENCILNGDTTGSPRGASHQDSDTAALALNATFLKAFDGLRKKAFANDAALTAGDIVYDHGGDTPSKVMFEKLLKLMGKFGSEKSDLLFVLPSSVENAVVTGAIPELFTAFAFGGIASNVTGEVPPIFGIKSITSQFAREDLNASGVYAAASDLTSVILVKRSRFARWLRQAPRIWAAPSLPSSDIMLMTSKVRHSWNGNNQSATEKSVVMAKNVATS